MSELSQEQKEWLKKHTLCTPEEIRELSINDSTQCVDIPDDLYVNINSKTPPFPGEIGRVSKDCSITIYDTIPDVLEKCKVQIVDNHFIISLSGSATVTSLKGSPRYVGGNFGVRDLHIDNFEDGPAFIGGKVYAGQTTITSFKGLPPKVAELYLGDCNNINSIEGLPSCTNATGIMINSDKLTSLKGIHKTCKFVISSTTKDPSLYFRGCPIKSHVLGVLLIKGITGVYWSTSFPKEVRDIISESLKIPVDDRDLPEIRDRMIAAGFPEYARL